MVTTNTGVLCYDADFTPFGGERPYTDTCTQNNYKFEGKERDTETGNDDFGARYYSWRFGRWLSADWSNVPAPVPYANLANPQTLNLYAMVADDPESFADLDGHLSQPGQAGNSCSDIAGGNCLEAEVQAAASTASAAEQNQNSSGATAQADSGTTQQGAQNQKPQYDNPQNEAEARLSNVVYNETSSLRPDPNSKPGTGGSAEALHDAREGIAEVANRVIDSGHPERVAPSELNDKDRRALSSGNADAINAHNDSLAAARQALGGANNTSGDTQYRLRTRSVSPDRPINGKDTNFTYGPFINTIGRRETVVFAP